MRNISRRNLLSFARSPSADSDPLVHIASLLVHATPSGCEAVRRTLAALPGAELHGTEHPNKLAIVLESADDRAIAAAVSELQELTGVLTVAIVAHLTERASLLDETRAPEDNDGPATVPAA